MELKNINWGSTDSEKQIPHVLFIYIHTHMYIENTHTHTYISWNKKRQEGCHVVLCSLWGSELDSGYWLYEY